MRKRFKRAALSGLQRAGLFRRFAASEWRRSRLAILCYHGISIDDEHRWDPTLYMSPAEFEARLASLRDGGYRVLPLAEGIERLYAGKLESPSVAITFDDGGFDFYARAWPILKRFGYPATVYLTTYYCEDNRPVFDPASAYLLWKAQGRVLEGTRLGLSAPLDLRTPESRRQGWRRILDMAETAQFSADDKEAYLQQLAEAGDVDYCDLLRKRLLHIMNPAEVRQLQGAGVDIQLHTHRHRTPADRALFLQELRDNAAAIERMTGEQPSHFCYPCGINRPEFLPWLSEAGVQYATTCEPALASRDSHPLLLPRFVDHGNLSLVEFESCVSGFGLLLPNEGGQAA